MTAITEIPKIIDALRELTNDTTSSIESADNILKLKIPNLTSMNPKYLAIAYLILVVLDPRKDLKKFTDNKDILILSSSTPDKLVFPVYFGKTTFEMLKIAFRVELAQQDLLVEHFKMLLTYISALVIYMIGGVEDLEKEEHILTIEEQLEDEDEEYEEDEEDEDED